MIDKLLVDVLERERFVNQALDAVIQLNNAMNQPLIKKRKRSVEIEKANTERHLLLALYQPVFPFLLVYDVATLLT